MKCWRGENSNLNLREKLSVIPVRTNKENNQKYLHQLFHMTLVNAFNCFQSMCSLIKNKFSTLPSSPVMAPHSHPIFVFHFHNPRENFIQTLTNSKYITKYNSQPPSHKMDHQTNHLKFILLFCTILFMKNNRSEIHSPKIIFLV